MKYFLKICLVGLLLVGFKYEVVIAQTTKVVKEKEIKEHLQPLCVIDGVIFTLDVSSEGNFFSDLGLKSENVESINVIKGKEAIELYGEAGKNGVIEIATRTGVNSTFSSLLETQEISNKPLFIIDGKEFSQEKIDLKLNQVKSVNVIKGEKAIKLYGKKGGNGVVVITTKNKKAASVKEE